MSILDEAVDISKFEQGNLWIIWGKSASGKTHLGATFPKPMLYIRVGDDGANTIKNVEGVKAISAENPIKLKGALEEVLKDKKYKSVFVDTFSFVMNEWSYENIISKKKRMTQNDWGNLKSDTEELIRLAHQISLHKIIILSCHEVTESIEGMEEEVIPEIRPNVSKGARTYLEGMANYGIHTTKIEKEVTSKKTGETKTVVRYAAHIGPNPYYWTKFQIDSSIKLPDLMLNPSYNKILDLISDSDE